VASELRFLGIETSCDETAAAVFTDSAQVLSSVVFNQHHVHARYGGVVPELAARAHLGRVIPVIDEALRRSETSLSDLTAIAVHHRPGLVGALVIGVSVAKMLAASLDIPLLGVSHLEGHVYAARMAAGRDIYPCVALVASGGHTVLFHAKSPLELVRLGSTRDDAAGEAFDKSSALLGLGFPGGPAIDSLAKNGDAQSIDFPRGLTTSNDWQSRPFDFSFSGLKTAVARYLEATPDYAKANVAASFQEAIVDVLLLKSLAACKATGIESLLIAGGVAANSRLRAIAQERCDKAGIRLRIPAPGLCTDNGAMVAALGSLMVSAGRSPSPIAFDADSNLPVEAVSLN